MGVWRALGGLFRMDDAEARAERQLRVAAVRIDQRIVEVEGQMRRARAQAHAAAVAARRDEQRVEATQRSAAEAEQQAREALGRGDEQAARQALVRQSERLRELEQLGAVARERVEHRALLEAALRQLEALLESLRTERGAVRPRGSAGEQLRAGARALPPVAPSRRGELDEPAAPGARKPSSDR